MRSFSKWSIRRAAGNAQDWPDGLITARVGLSATNLPPIVALLLPNADGAQDLAAELGDVRPSGMGVFLADPNLVPARLSRQIARGSDWACNFPSVGQHEQEFRRYLAEVDLDHARELRVLSELRAAGLSTIATVSAERDVAVALSTRPAAILVVPPVPEFRDGAVSLDRRIALERAIAAQAEGVPLIGLRASDEAEHGLAASLLPPVEISR
ncbi:Phosphoenolpyruvate hydrolase-like [Palleronia marisminoris]|uniref:Uncharacterized protein n=1 Tax=Palleronia marisminoris TaxID=315423 RepID=A0A1Y5TVK0_9RHOB|nr:hypothetical protein [Palleronia marisminoris]SFH51250.1 Phosphoenolpyruvate hydrolase-like [Palleronia marisminoris]SLN70829.1 hypothetical protein PAM7066_03603 [Palleronia marisminoris]